MLRTAPLFGVAAVPVSIRRKVGLRVSSADISQAKAAAEKAGLRLVAFEKRPDGTVKLEFGEPEEADDWRAGSPLYKAQQ